MAAEIVDHIDHGSELIITIQGLSPDDVTDPAGRKVAYDARGKYGYETAGMEPTGGVYPVDLAKLKKGKKEEDALLSTGEQMKEISDRRKDLAYRHQYRFRRAL